MAKLFLGFTDGIGNIWDTNGYGAGYTGSVLMLDNLTDKIL